MPTAFTCKTPFMFIFRFLILTSQDATNSVTVPLSEILLITTDDSMLVRQEAKYKLDVLNYRWVFEW